MEQSDSGEFSFEELCDIVTPIALKHGVARVYLFGSRARGDNDSDSDFDFCISPGKIRGLIGLCGFTMDLEDALGRRVDVVSDRYLKDDFSKEIVQDGRLVYES